MKKSLLTLVFLVLACAGFAQSHIYHYKDSMLAVKADQSYDHVDGYSQYEIQVEMPEVPANVGDSIVRWLNDVFDVDSGVVFTDVDKLIRDRINRFRESEADDRKEGNMLMPYEYQTEVSLLTLNSKYVTMVCSKYLFFGGAHGMPVSYGVSFRMSDGKRILWDDMFKDRELLRPFLTKAFNVQNRDERPEWDMVYEFTESTPDTYPMPFNNPYLTEDNQLAFIYQPYEIGPFAMGMPSCSIPALELKDILKPDFLKLITP